MSERQSREVVVIDDDQAVLDSFRFMLQSVGFDVTTYLSATDFLASDEAAPRCLILDQNMPTMTGLQLAQRLQSAGVNIPMLLITSALTASIRAQASKAGVDKVLAKPPAADEVIGFVLASQ